MEEKKEIEVIFEKYGVKMEIVKDFLLYKMGLGQSETTLRNHSYCLGYFIKNFEINSIEDFVKLSANDISLYFQDKVNNKLISPQTRNTYMCTIKEFYKYLISIDYEVDTKILNIPKAKAMVKTDIFLNRKEAYLMWEAINDIRTKCIVGLMLYNGLRVSELINLKLESLVEVENDFGFFVYVFKILGKGNKERVMATTSEVHDYIKVYIETRRQHTLNRLNITSEYLFVSDLGNQMSAGNLTTMTKTYAGRINHKDADKFSAHKLRHSYATLMYDKGNEVATISKSMGHANIATTSGYIHVEDKKVLEMQMEGF